MKLRLTTFFISRLQSSSLSVFVCKVHVAGTFQECINRNVQKSLYFKAILQSYKNEEDLAVKLEESCCGGIEATIWSGLIKQKQSGGSVAPMCILNQHCVLGNVYHCCTTDCTAGILKNIAHMSH